MDNEEGKILARECGFCGGPFLGGVGCINANCPRGIGLNEEELRIYRAWVAEGRPGL